MRTSKKNPRLCFVGPMLGHNKGWVVTQGEILADLFARDGYVVRSASKIPNRILRLVDIIRSLILWRREIDIVNLSVFSGLGFVIVDVVSLLVKSLHKPLIYVLRGGNLPRFSHRHEQWVRRVLRRSDVLVSPSAYLADFYRGWEFDVKVIPNVLSIERYPFRHRRQVQPNLLWMRTFEDIYNPEMAIYVLRQLRKDYPQANLTMAGQDRGLQASVKRLAEQSHLGECVRFPGFLDLAGKQREFPAHDIFLNTNRVDNMPVSVIEAAAFGLPIVATAVGGVPYLLQHEDTALLVDDEDVQGMVNAVKRLISTPELSARLSVGGRCLAGSCAWPHVKIQWENAFHEIMNQ